MSDDELFENWWRVHSPPGTFDKAQCKVAFIAGLVTQRVEAAQQSVQADGAYCTCQHIERPPVDKAGICFSCHQPRR